MEKLLVGLDKAVESPITWGVITLILAAAAATGRFSVRMANLLFFLAWLLGSYGILRQTMLRDTRILLAASLALGAVLLFCSYFFDPGRGVKKEAGIPWDTLIPKTTLFARPLPLPTSSQKQVIYPRPGFEVTACEIKPIRWDSYVEDETGDVFAEEVSAAIATLRLKPSAALNRSVSVKATVSIRDSKGQLVKNQIDAVWVDNRESPHVYFGHAASYDLMLAWISNDGIVSLKHKMRESDDHIGSLLMPEICKLSGDHFALSVNLIATIGNAFIGASDYFFEVKSGNSPSIVQIRPWECIQSTHRERLFRHL